MNMTKAIVIAGGQSLYDEKIIDVLLDHYVKDEKIPNVTILSTDRTLKYVLENGIIPEYCCIQENLITAEGVDNLKLFFFHGIVKSHAHEITLYHSQILTKERQQLVKDMGFKTVIFNRFGCGGNLPNIINTSGNCGMALVEIARKLLKIDKIAVIGLDLDFSRDWKIYKKDNPRTVESMLTNSKQQVANDYFEIGQDGKKLYPYPTYNLTKKGSFHGGIGIKEITVEEFLDE